MKTIDLTGANLLDEMIHGEGWKILQEVVDDILSTMEKKIMQKDTPAIEREKVVVEYYHLKDFMRIPAIQINKLVAQEKLKEVVRKNYDPYPQSEA